MQVGYVKICDFREMTRCYSKTLTVCLHRVSEKGTLLTLSKINRFLMIFVP